MFKQVIPFLISLILFTSLASAQISIHDLPAVTPGPNDVLPIEVSPSWLTKSVSIANLSRGLGWIDVRAYGADPLGVVEATASFNSAIAAASVNQTVIAPRGLYKLGALATITKPIILDFGGSYIYPSTTGIVIPISVDGTAYNEHIIVRNANFLSGTANPANIIKIIKGNNTVLDNINISGVTTTGPMVWNLASYGLRIRNGIFHFNTAPEVILMDQTTGDTTHSFAFDIDVDISNHTGIGILVEGGDGKIKGVIEGCSGGGLKYDGTGNLSVLDVSAYFELNSSFDISLTGDGASTTGRGIFIHSSKFIGNISLNKILIGNNVHVIALGNFYQYGGVDGIAGAPFSIYTGIANTMSQYGAGYTTGYEIADAIRSTIPHTIIGDSNLTGTGLPRGQSTFTGIKLPTGNHQPAGTVTLTPNEGSTTVNHLLVTANSLIFLFPVTANAAADYAAGMYISAVTAETSFIITHPNNGNADKVFNYLIIN